MYRGSSFLLQRDYKVHIPIVKEILKLKTENNELLCKALSGISCSDLKEKEKNELLWKLVKFLRDKYGKIRYEVSGTEIEKGVSDILITKVLMGTLGCVPAYDSFFVKAAGTCKDTTGVFNENSIKNLIEFFEKINPSLVLSLIK